MYMFFVFQTSLFTIEMKGSVYLVAILNKVLAHKTQLKIAVSVNIDKNYSGYVDYDVKVMNASNSLQHAGFYDHVCGF